LAKSEAAATRRGDSAVSLGEPQAVQSKTRRIEKEWYAVLNILVNIG
jgi:hypothetical protein